MNYQRHYDLLISRAQSRIPIGSIEKHHIIPKCLNGSNDKTNIAKLYPREHYMAHLLLVKIHPKHKGLKAAIILLSKNTKSGRMYERNRKAFIQSQSKEKSHFFGLRPWEHPRQNELSLISWLLADKAFDMFNNGLGDVVISRTFGTGISKFSKMIKMFKSGWEPCEDEDWVAFRNENINKLEAFTIKTRPKRSKLPWLNPGLKDPSQWLIADQIKDQRILKENVTSKKLLKRLRDGWDPINDQNWVSWKVEMTASQKDGELF